MTKDEALKLALEALKQIDEAMPFPVAKLAQAAIKEALAQPEHGWTPERIAGMARLKEAQDKKLAQPEQEPVEWGVDWGPDGNSVSIIKRLADGGIEVVGWEYAPHPPQRTWVGLTDDEILSISADCASSHQHTDIHFARAIEAKLRSKNS